MMDGMPMNDLQQLSIFLILFIEIKRKSTEILNYKRLSRQTYIDYTTTIFFKRKLLQTNDDVMWFYYVLLLCDVIIHLSLRYISIIQISMTTQNQQGKPKCMITK